MIYPADSAIHRLNNWGQLFKGVFVREVVWKNHGDCRKIWFPRIEGTYGQRLLKEFKVSAENCEIESQKMRAVVLLDLTKPLLFQHFTRSHDDHIYSMAGMECLHCTRCRVGYEWLQSMLLSHITL